MYNEYKKIFQRSAFSRLRDGTGHERHVVQKRR